MKNINIFKWLMFSCALLLVSMPVLASELEFQIVERSNMADEDTFQVGRWVGLQVSYTPKEDFYWYGSLERAEIHVNSYRAFDYGMLGFGVGSKTQISNRISVFGQVGLLGIFNSWGDRKNGESEAFEYYLNRKWYGLTDVYYGETRWLSFDAYSVKNSQIEPVIEFGVQTQFYKSKNYDVYFTASYRILKIDEKIAGYRAEFDSWGPGQYWTTSQRRNYSSINIGLVFSYKF